MTHRLIKSMLSVPICVQLLPEAISLHAGHMPIESIDAALIVMVSYQAKNQFSYLLFILS